MNIFKKQKAQTLVEVTMSIGIAVIVIVALVVLATSALRNAQESLRKSESTKFANAGIEAVIFYKNVNGFASFTTGSYKIVNTAQGSTLEKIGGPTDTNTGTFVSITSPSGLTYERNISVTVNSGTLDVISIVQWPSTQGTKQSRIDRKITDWR